MIIPPPIITPKKKRNWSLIFVGVVVAVFALFYVMMFASIWITPSIGEDDYLHDVEESPATLTELGFKGSVIATRRNTLTLYTAKEETEFYTTPWRLYDLAGPNENGHLVVFEIDQMKDTYRFKLLDFNTGTERIAHEGRGDVIWDGAIGEMVMHPTEDKVIYFTETGHRQYPGAYTNVGKLIELDLITEKKTELAADVVQNEFAISPDGKSIFYSRSTSDSQPQITQREIGTTNLKTLGEGWRCSLSYDSNSLIIYNTDYIPSHSIDLETRNSEALEKPDYYFWPISRMSDSFILARSLPLTKETAKYFPPTGSISGAHLMIRLGVFDPKGKRAAILRTDLDRYEPIAHTGQMLSANKFKAVAKP